MKTTLLVVEEEKTTGDLYLVALAFSYHIGFMTHWCIVQFFPLEPSADMYFDCAPGQSISQLLNKEEYS